MNNIYELHEDELRGGIFHRVLLLLGRNRVTWQTVGAVVGLFGGLLSLALAVLIWAVVGLISPAGAPGSFLEVAGTVLFVLPLPLLALGAHCLDLLEKKAPALPFPAAPRAAAPSPLLRTRMTER